MSAAFDHSIKEVLAAEGGYVNDPRDSGGETNFGITVAVARAFGFTGPMRDMTRDQAKAIYKARFWDALRLDDISALSEAIAIELFDTAVNQGTGRAGEYLQRALNVLNNGGQMYRDIPVDGRVGPMTVACLREYLGNRGVRGELVLCRALNSLQGAFYITLAEQRAKDEAFVFGWLLNRVA
jgi:lysozyme family protein